MKNHDKKSFSTIGAMAGSSMDGLDLIHASLHWNGSSWGYSAKVGKTVPFDEKMYSKLKESPKASFQLQKQLDMDFGEWIGAHINDFIKVNSLNIDFISAHGHTVIHQPENNISWQLGSGQRIADKTGITTITDFRSKDISFGGQGAPLVPVGDFQLFKAYDACLNLGGIANISLKQSMTAWDITPCNQVLNYYANKLGKAFDENGELSRQGEVSLEFIHQIGEINFFKSPPPKSLPNQFIEYNFLNRLTPENGLRSMTEFIAKQIAYDLKDVFISNPKMLITGGGAHNSFLIERIKDNLPNWDISIPSKNLIDFKEAIVFAFLGALRLRNEINVLASVTGAMKDSSSGVIHFAK